MSAVGNEKKVTETGNESSTKANESFTDDLAKAEAGKSPNQILPKESEPEESTSSFGSFFSSIKDSISKGTEYLTSQIVSIMGSEESDTQTEFVGCLIGDIDKYEADEFSCVRSSLVGASTVGNTIENLSNSISNAYNSGTVSQMDLTKLADTGYGNADKAYEETPKIVGIYAEAGNPTMLYDTWSSLMITHNNRARMIDKEFARGHKDIRHIRDANQANAKTLKEYYNAITSAPDERYSNFKLNREHMA